MATPPRRRLPAHLQPFIAGSRDPGGLSKEDRSPGAQDPKGSSGPFSFSPEIGTGEGKRKEKVRRKNQAEREGSEMANVLFSDLLVPGWADTKIGLKEVTGTFGDRHAYSLPCHNANPETFFSEEKAVIEQAKRLCAPCPVRNECLKGALSRQEPCGVWGGELFHEGRVIAERRGVGRPRLVRVG